MMNKILLSALAVILPAFFCGSADGQQTGAAVQVIQRVQPDGSALYQYLVSNNTAKAIVGFSVGSDYYHGTSELNVYPQGWSADTGIATGTITSPASWSPIVVTTEESAFVEVEWRNDGTADIAPGQTQMGFGVVTAHANDQYISSHYTLYFSDASASSGSLTLAQAARIVIKVTDQTSLGGGQWRISLQVANTGAATARNVLINRLLLKTLVGTGAASVMNPSTPVTIGTLNGGATSSVTFTVNIPSAVKKLSLTEAGSVQVDTGATQAFSSAQVVYAKT